MTIPQLSVFMENRAGQLAEITSALAENNIDLRAINIAETSDYGVLRIIADQPRLAAQVLSEKGFVVSVTPVIAVTVHDQPGGLSRALYVMAEENIDIEYMYSVFGQHNGDAFMIFRVEDDEKLAAVLIAAGYTVATGSDIGIKA